LSGSYIRPGPAGLNVGDHAELSGVVADEAQLDRVLAVLSEFASRISAVPC